MLGPSSASPEGTVTAELVTLNCESWAASEPITGNKLLLSLKIVARPKGFTWFNAPKKPRPVAGLFEPSPAKSKATIGASTAAVTVYVVKPGSPGVGIPASA